MKKGRTKASKSYLPTQSNVQKVDLEGQLILFYRYNCESEVHSDPRSREDTVLESSCQDSLPAGWRPALGKEPR
jgi:hypothetical protein